MVSGLIILTFICDCEGKSQKSEPKTRTLVNLGFDRWKSQHKHFYSLCRRYLFFFVFLKLMLGLYSVISSKNHFVLSVTNAPEFGPLQRVSYIYFISLFFDKSIRLLYSLASCDSFWKCRSALKIMDGQSAQRECVSLLSFQRSAFHSECRPSAETEYVYFFPPPSLKALYWPLPLFFYCCCNNLMLRLRRVSIQRLSLSVRRAVGIFPATHRQFFSCVALSFFPA